MLSLLAISLLFIPALVDAEPDPGNETDIPAVNLTDYYDYGTSVASVGEWSMVISRTEATGTTGVPGVYAQLETSAISVKDNCGTELFTVENVKEIVLLSHCKDAEGVDKEYDYVSNAHNPRNFWRGVDFAPYYEASTCNPCPTSHPFRNEYPDVGSGQWWCYTTDVPATSGVCRLSPSDAILYPPPTGSWGTSQDDCAGDVGCTKHVTGAPFLGEHDRPYELYGIKTSGGVGGGATCAALGLTHEIRITFKAGVVEPTTIKLWAPVEQTGPATGIMGHAIGPWCWDKNGANCHANHGGQAAPVHQWECYKGNADLEGFEGRLYPDFVCPTEAPYACPLGGEQCPDQSNFPNNGLMHCRFERLHGATVHVGTDNWGSTSGASYEQPFVELTRSATFGSDSDNLGPCVPVEAEAEKDSFFESQSFYILLVFIVAIFLWLWYFDDDRQALLEILTECFTSFKFVDMDFML